MPLTIERTSPPASRPEALAGEFADARAELRGRTEALLGHEQLAIRHDRLAASGGQTHRVPVIPFDELVLRNESHSQLGVVGLVVEDSQISVGRVDAPGGERPDSFDHPATVDLPGSVGHPPAGTSQRKRAIPDPGGLVHRRDDLIGKRVTPQISPGGRPHDPGRGPASGGERSVDVMELSCGEVGPSESLRRAQAEDTGRVEALDALLRNSALLLGHGLVLA